MLRWSLLLLAVLLSGCSRAERPAPPAPAPLGEGPADLPGIHNVCRITDKLYSGSQPLGDEGFRSLQERGFHTIISVDGAIPEVSRASAFGLRYVHLPIGYDGVPREQALKIARAVRDLPGLVYLHCHHGKHRGPAAAVVARRCLDPGCTAEQALALLKQMGTAPEYIGLFEAVKEYGVVSSAELDGVSADFPAEATVPGLVTLMVELDKRWDRLKLVRAAGWKTPPGNPDLDPAHEARLIREAYAEMARLPEVNQRPEKFRRWMNQANEAVGRLETVFVSGKETQSVNESNAKEEFRYAASFCTSCHAKYRNVPAK
jgi:protein tyrosine phosphatase (PTP) superfamily phosphohydrolase (DUF442 family)